MNKTLLRLLAGFLGSIILAAVLAFILTVYKPFSPRETLPKLDKVTSFNLTERSGQPITDAVFQGKVSVVDFFFTACPGPCLKLSTNFSTFQKEIASLPDTQLVSFSVNPSGDTPEVLSKYATRFEADPQRWLFITGDKEKIYGLIENSFRLAVQENYDPKAPPDEKFIHSTKIVLLDRTGTIRAYYDGLDPETYPKLKTDIKRLREE